MRYLKYSLLFALLISLIITLGGCTALIHDSLVNKTPFLLETLDTAPTLTDDMARVVLYYPRDVAIGILGPGGMGFKKVKIQGDAGSIAFEVLDQCGCYIDIPGGNYEFDEVPNQIFTFQNGCVYYIKIGKEKPGLSLSSMGGIKPTLLDASTARSEITKFKIKTLLINSNALSIALVPSNLEKSKLIPQLTDMSIISVEKQIEQEPIASELARLYIINNLGWVGGAGKLRVGIDGTPSSLKLGRKKYMCIDMAPGVHTLSTSMSSIGIEQAPAKFLQKFNLRKGVNRYLVLEINKGLYFSSVEEGRELIKKYKLSKGGYYSLTR